jgi:hypothetical protein
MPRLLGAEGIPSPTASWLLCCFFPSHTPGLFQEYTLREGMGDEPESNELAFSVSLVAGKRGHRKKE